MMAEDQKIIVVAGDVTMDWNIIKSHKRNISPQTTWIERDIRSFRQPGGAALLADLIEKAGTELGKSKGGFPQYIVRRSKTLQEPIESPDLNLSFAVWSQHKCGPDSESNERKLVWRVEEFLGVSKNFAQSPAKQRSIVEEPLSKADLIVFDDAGLGFRNQRDQWDKLTTMENRPWIILKMASPVLKGELYQKLIKHYADRLILVMAVNDLRRTAVQISRELSWERTAQDLLWELIYNPLVKDVARCAYTVVSFNAGGALLLSGREITAENNLPECVLFFDPENIENMWEQNHPGGMIGYTSCLVAGIARQVMDNFEEPDIAAGIKSGLAAMRRLHLEGYKSIAENDITNTESSSESQFPINEVVGELAEPKTTFATARVPNPVSLSKDNISTMDFWTILKDQYGTKLNQVVEDIVRSGVEETLKNVPLGRFGDLITIDRNEIESYRSIRSLIMGYCEREQENPLSIAVFGPPGTGKSFAIKQLVNSTCPDKIKVLGFNLSQFNEPGDLYKAFHQVRDHNLANCVPLVFWDEFDAQLNREPLGWLRYFLAPMQDGSFQEEQIIHPIGRAIFVFIGGTYPRMESLENNITNNSVGFQKAKGPDFISRLKGYINILGPDPRLVTEGIYDPYYIIRRAIFLRSILKRLTPQIFTGKHCNIDDGVLNAFLSIKSYKHGVRSMEAIIAMSRFAKVARFERSCLPSEIQLNLHVDGNEFYAWVQQPKLEGDLLEKMAEAAYDIYRAGNGKDDNQYGQLDESRQEATWVTVRNIPKKLAAAGCIMMSVRGHEISVDFPGEKLEKLAELEHELWMENKLAKGFKPGNPTDEDRKRNPYLVPWEKLPEEIKNIDRDLVKGIPEILNKAGYTIVKVTQ
jgi:hypothetical protein